MLNDILKICQRWQTLKFVTASFLSLIKGGNNNLFPRIHLHNTNAFFEDLTGKHFYSLAYKLHFFTYWSPNAAQMNMFFHNSSTIIDLSRMLSYAVCYEKIPLKFVVFSQQPCSQDLCVNTAHIRSKTFRCLRKYNCKVCKSLFSSSY